MIGTNRIIKEGLTGKERVIIEGVQRARPGITVRVVEAKKQPVKK